jgi:hypothetical protein
MTAYNPYDLRRFIDSVKDLDHAEIVKAVSNKRYQLQSLSVGRKGAVNAREMGSMELARQLSGFPKTSGTV